jgi:hypothetical protein
MRIVSSGSVSPASTLWATSSNNTSPHKAQRLPAVLATFNTILFYQCIRVIEDVARDLKADSMLSPVALRFGIVPLEPYHAMP